MLPPTLHVGFSNYILTDQIVALIDYRCTAARGLVKRARELNENKVYDFSRGRKIYTLIALKDDLFCLSTIPRKALLRRLGLIEEEEPEPVKGKPSGKKT